MLRGTGAEAGTMRACPELRAIMRFSRLNLNDESPYAVGEPFDLVFCRNVMIYFTPEGRARVTDRLLRHVGADGYFFVGHAESLHGHRHAVRTIIPTVYTKHPV
jgi:chemotaxis protein methyltransferase CheR